MSTYRDLAEFYEPDLLLPIGGHIYRIRCPGIREGDRLRDLIFRQQISAEQEHAEIVQILGAAREEMADRGVPDTMAIHAGRTALLHFGGSPSLALSNWQLASLGDYADVKSYAARSAKAAPGT